MVSTYSLKVYVEVMAVFTPEGRLIPRTITWEDGRVYQIDRVTDVRRACSLKAGGTGMRYTCMISGKTTHLFYEDDNKWFVERKTAAV